MTETEKIIKYYTSVDSCSREARATSEELHIPADTDPKVSPNNTKLITYLNCMWRRSGKGNFHILRLREGVLEWFYSRIKGQPDDMRLSQALTNTCMRLCWDIKGKNNGQRHVNTVICIAKKCYTMKIHRRWNDDGHYSYKLVVTAENSTGSDLPILSRRPSERVIANIAERTRQALRDAKLLIDPNGSLFNFGEESDTMPKGKPKVRPTWRPSSPYYGADQWDQHTPKQPKAWWRSRSTIPTTTPSFLLRLNIPTPQPMWELNSDTLSSLTMQRRYEMSSQRPIIQRSCATYPTTTAVTSQRRISMRDKIPSKFFGDRLITQ